ncbi:unnamed protein product [Trichobilharzia szidati]|nr:unnamed protein product [Trichobilharzia szidati]
MPNTQTIFIEGEKEIDSNIYNTISVLDALPTKEIISALIIDLVYYHMCLKGYQDINLFTKQRGKTSQSDQLLDQLIRCIVAKGKQFENKFKPRFENRHGLLLKTPEKAQLDYMETLDNIWSDKLINWGRFLSYVTFVASYCIGCLDIGMVYIIKLLVEYAIKDLDRKISHWIRTLGGGWRGLYHALNTMKLD